MLSVGILCGGFGTRMKQLGRPVPKALMEIGGRPVLDSILRSLTDIEDAPAIFLVSNAVFADQFQTWAKESGAPGRPVKILNNGVRTAEQRLGSVGDIQFMVENGPVASDFLIIGGDNLYDYSLRPFVQFAKERGPSVVVCDIQDLDEAKRFGVVERNGTQRLVDFQEKPEAPRSTLIATCLYYFRQQDLPMMKEYIDSGASTDASGSLISWLVRTTSVYGWTAPGAWFDIGSQEALAEAEEAFRSGD